MSFEPMTPMEDIIRVQCHSLGVVKEGRDHPSADAGGQFTMEVWTPGKFLR